MPTFDIISCFSTNYDTEMVPEHTRVQVAGEKPIQTPAPFPGAELANPPPGNGELPMLGHSFPKATSQTPEKLSSKFLVHLQTMLHVLICRIFFDGGKMDF